MIMCLFYFVTAEKKGKPCFESGSAFYPCNTAKSFPMNIGLPQIHTQPDSYRDTPVPAFKRANTQREEFFFSEHEGLRIKAKKIALTSCSFEQFIYI